MSLAEGENPKLTQLETEFVVRLSDEYKILQDKIDKIGAFRFTIKGWSITVILAAVFASTATDAMPAWLLFIALFAFLALFFLYEKQQTNLRYKFGQRCLQIEAVVSRLLRNAAEEAGDSVIGSSFLDLQYVPGIGHHVGRQRHRHRRRRRKQWSHLQSLLEADFGFYLVQLALVGLFVWWHAGVSARGTRGAHAPPTGIYINQPLEAPSQTSEALQPTKDNSQPKLKTHDEIDKKAKRK